jgi:GAF domain-containing protein
MIATEQLAAVFVEVADTLVDDFDVIEFMQMLTTRTSEMFDVTAAGVLLSDHNARLHLMAASDERTEMLELFQLQTHEGPCQDCFNTGEAIIATDLTTAADRWPRFAPHAVAAGFGAVHAFPMRLRGDVIGALNLFSNSAAAMTAFDRTVVQALADVATVGLLQERAIRRAEVLTEQLQRALNSRIAIEQAKGALAQIHGCSTDQAFDMMRAYARERGRPLTEVATQVTTAPSTLVGLTTPQPGI